MKRYSLLWTVCIVLKFVAIFTIVEALLGFGRESVNLALRTSDGNVMTSLLGFSVVIDRNVYAVWGIISRILNGAAKAGLLWAAADVIRMVANTEAYARGTYSLSRRRAGGGDAPAESASMPVKRRPASEPLPPVFDDRPTAPADLKYSPTAGYRQQRLPMSPVRRVTVLKQRRAHEVHPPRPVGTVEVIDSLDGTHEARSSLPFDTV